MSQQSTLSILRSKDPASLKRHGPQVERLVRYLRSTQATSIDEPINPAESPEDRVIHNLDELRYHFSRPKPPRIVTEIIQLLMPRMLQERAGDMPEAADVVLVSCEDFFDDRSERINL